MRVIKVKAEDLKLLKDAGKLCRMSYPGHKEGCPNYGKLCDCPPKVSTLFDYFDKSMPFCFVVYRFNMARHVKRMKAVHPNWSDKQLRNVYYWQNSVRAKLKRRCAKLCSHRGYDVFVLKPEGMGLNMFGTMRKYGIKLQRNPTDIVYKIALVGYRKTSKKRWQF